MWFIRSLLVLIINAVECKRIVVVFSMNSLAFDHSFLCFELAASLIEFLFGTTGHIQEQLFARKIGPFLTGTGLLNKILVYIIAFVVAVLPSQLDRQTIVAERMVSQNYRVGSDFGR